MKFLLAAILSLLALGAASAQPAIRSINDCERIKGDLAYNQCLAQFGPRAGGGATSAASAPRATSEELYEDARPAVRQRGRGRYVRRSRGRQVASFEVGRRSEVRSERRATRRSARRRR